MKTVMVTIFAILLACFMIACEGDRGPAGSRGATGPTGEQGEIGPAGDDGTVTVIYITGVVAVGDYETTEGGTVYIDIRNALIREAAITQVYLSSDADTYAWRSIDNWELTNGAIYIVDQYSDFLGYDFMLKIIPTNN